MAQRVNVYQRTLDSQPRTEFAIGVIKRPEFAKMLAFLRVNAAVIMVEKNDRLYRNLKDWIALDDLKAKIHFAKEGSVISPDSHSSERFLHGIKVLMAKNYVENLSEEIRKERRIQIPREAAQRRWAQEPSTKAE
jgi:DNA invertase Pin-like site-specific DNA recombinase